MVERYEALVEGSVGGEAAACEGDNVNEEVVALDHVHEGSLDGFLALVVVTDDRNCLGEVGLAVVVMVVIVHVHVMCCTAVAVAAQVVVQGEAYNADGEEHPVLDLVEGSCTVGIERAVGMAAVVVVVVVAGYLSSDCAARRIHDDSGLFCSVQNTVYRSPREPA